MKKIIPFILIWIAIGANAQWSQLGGPPGGNMVDLERISAGKIYSVSNQELYESSNNGVSWTKTTITTPAANFRLDDLAIDAVAGKLYAINYSVLYSSTDATNWTKVSTDGQFYGVYRVRTFGPDGFLVISGWNGVYVSKDGGINFTKILDDNIYDQSRLQANIAGDLFAPTKFGIKRYLYPGAAGTFSSANWINVYPLPITNNIYEVSLGIDGSNNLFAQVRYDDGNFVNEILGSSSANNGNLSTWTALLRSGLPNNNFSGSWARNGSNIFFLNNDGGKIYSNSSQATTTFNLTGANININDNYITVTNIGALKLGDQISGTGIPTGAYVTDIYASNDFRISKNATATNTLVTLTVTTLTTPWTVINSPSKPYGSNMSNIVFVSASNFVIGTDNDGIFHTTNSGTSFSQGAGLTFGNGTQVAVANVTGRIIYLSNNNSKGYWTSINNGTSWTFVSLPEYVRRIIKLSSGTLLLYGDRVYRSTDNGASFVEVSTNYYNQVKEHPTTAGKLYASNGANLYSSVDGGLTWGAAITLTGMPASYGFESITVSDTDVIYAVVYNGIDQKRYPYKIVSGAGTLLPNAPWAELQYFYANNIFIQNGGLYISSSDAIYKTTTEGSSWATNNFSGSFVFPLTQGGFSGIVISRYGTLYVTQDDGKTYNSAPLPTSNSTVTQMALDLSGNLIASASNSPALKYTGNLTVNPTTLPPFIDFNWQPTNGPFGGYTRKVAKDNANNVWTITNGRLFKTSTFVTWQKVPVLDQNGNEVYINDFIYDAVANKIYAGSYNEIYTSVDGGTIWTKISTEQLKGVTVMARLANGNIVYYTYNDGGEIYVSTDGGATFGLPKYELGNENFDKLVVTSNAIFLNLYDYDLNKRKLLRSTDNGVTWTQPVLPVTFLDNISSDLNNVYAWSGNQLHKSSNNGDAWTNISGDLAQGPTFESKVFTAPNSDLVILGYPYGMIRSSNGGVNWTKVADLSTSNAIFDIAWVGTRITFATNDGIFTSDDGGLTYTKRSTGITGYNINDLKLIGNKRILAGGFSKPFVSSDFQNWADVGNGAGSYFRGLIELPSGELIAYSCNQIFRSLDGGQNWTTQQMSTCIDQLYTADGVNFYNRQYEKLQYSNDLVTWTDLSISGLPTTGYNEIAADLNGIVYLLLYNQTAQANEVYQILFGSALKLNFTTSPRSISFNNGKILIFDSQGTIHETTDGSTWTTKGAASGDKLIITSNNYFFVPSYGGVLWLSRDQGLSWQQVGFNDPGNTFTDVVVNEFDGYAYGSITRSVVRKSANIVIPADATNPVIAGLMPANNASNIDAATNLTITFDEAVIPKSGKTLRILDLANPVVALETIDVTNGTQNGKSFTYNPTINLDFSKTYFAVMDNGAFEDIFGNAFAGFLNNTTWRFTTKAKPSVTALAPANNGTSVPLNQVLQITFSEPVIGVTGKNFSIYKTSAPSTAVVAVLTTSGTVTGNSISYTLAAGTLEFETSYFVQFETGSLKTAGGVPFSQLTTNTDWTFTTAEAPDTQKPVITMITTPLNLDKGVAKTFEVRVTDNKVLPVDKTKIYYRGITKLSTEPFTAATMPVSTGSGTATSNFTIAAAESWYDEMGIEFYVETEDGAGNMERLPPLGTYNYSYIKYPSAASPAIPTSRLSFGGKESDYRIISVPYTLENAQVTTVLNELGSVDNTKWRMFTYDPSKKDFTENPSTLDRGKGYWINVRNSPGNILIEGATTPSNNKTNFFTMRFYDEWNQIGNPYPVAINWAQVKANASELTDLKVYNGSTYTNATELAPFEGGFVLVNLPVNIPFIDVKVRFKDILAGGRIKETVGSDISENNWEIPIHASNNEMTNTFGGVGMNEKAKLDWDQYDDINPPRFLKYAELAFKAENLLKLPLAKHVVPTTEEFVWEFDALAENGITVLKWDHTTIEGAKDLMLLDVQNQILIDMKHQGSYSFSAEGSNPFKVYFGTDLANRIKPNSISLGKPYPNPTNKLSFIKYTVPENQHSYKTALEVYNSQGKKVSTLRSGDLAPGFYTAEWDVANNPNGLYFYRLTVVENGKLNSLTEKIIINR